MNEKIKTIQARIPLPLYRDILKVQKELQRETVERFGKSKPITFPRAALVYHKRRFNFGGGLI